MKALLSIVICLSFQIGFAANPILKKPKSTGELNTCERFIILVNQREFHQARSLINHAANTTVCETITFLRAKARLEAAFMHFNAAEQILLPLAEAHPENDSIQREWNHYVNMLGSLGNFQPIAIQPITNPNNDQKIMIGWMQDTIPKLLCQNPGVVSLYPYRQVGRTYNSFSIADLESEPLLPLIKNKLIAKGYEDILGMSFIENEGIVVSVKRPLAYSSKSNSNREELLWFNVKGKFIVELPQMDCDCNNAHPVYDSLQSKLYFASDREGSFGGMDIWWMQKTRDTWSLPQNLGSTVNTIYDEIIPTISSDTVFYSSNAAYSGFGGFDIYAYKTSDGTVRNMGIPINSAFDEYSFNVLGQGLGIWVTNRNDSIASHQLFKARWTVKENFFKELKGHVESTAGLSGMEVLLLDEHGEIIDRAVLDANHNFTFKHVKGKDHYRIEISQANLEEGSSLQLFDASDKKILDVVASTSIGFVFELLTPIDYSIELMENDDVSSLSVDIFGQIEKGAGLKIFLQDSYGEEIATTHTSENGTFKFISVPASDKYQIKTEVVNWNQPIHILDPNGKIIKSILPTSGNEFVYVRVEENEGLITITNDFTNQPQVTQEDIQAIGTVQYEHKSVDLSKNGQAKLDQLAEILLDNPNIRIELEGHTDCTGSEAFNLQLSNERIEAAMIYLHGQGIESYRLYGKGYGESKPIIVCQTEDSCSEKEHAVNRRLEFRLIDMSEVLYQH